MDVKLGSLEQSLMLTVLRLGERAHGLAIREEMKGTGGRDVSPGAVYTVLDRLEKRGFVASWISDETPESGSYHRRERRVVEVVGVERGVALAQVERRVLRVVAHVVVVRLQQREEREGLAAAAVRLGAAARAKVEEAKLRVEGILPEAVVAPRDQRGVERLLLQPREVAQHRRTDTAIQSPRAQTQR